jgi:hypothetical protein
MKLGSITRTAVLRSWGAALPLLLCPPKAYSDDFLSDAVRRAVVRSAQYADKADSIWQQISGEVVPSWQVPTSSPFLEPPPYLNEAFANDLLNLPLQVGARCAGMTIHDLESRLPEARREAVLLYRSSGQDGAGSNTPAPATVVRSFPVSLATAISEGQPQSNSTIFGFEAYVRWRVLSDVLSDGRAPAERKRLQRCFNEGLGTALLQGPLQDVSKPAALSAALPRRERSLRNAVDGCSALLESMRAKGLFAKATLQLSLGSGTDLFDEGDWQLGGSTSWQYVVSGSALVGGSQLAQDRTATIGAGAGLYPGQCLTAPLAAYLKQVGIDARIDEYFLDNRVGRPDPRTFADPRYYSDVLLEVVALEED